MLVQPVCTTEIGRLALKYDDLKAKGVKLATLSADPVRQHSLHLLLLLCMTCCLLLIHQMIRSFNLFLKIRILFLNLFLIFRCQVIQSG